MVCKYYHTLDKHELNKKDSFYIDRSFINLFVKMVRIRIVSHIQYAGVEVQQRAVHLVKDGGEQLKPEYRYTYLGRY